MSGGKVSDQIKIVLRSRTGSCVSVYIDVFDNSLSTKWLAALKQLVVEGYHLEKNYCFLGFNGQRNGEYILAQINNSIDAINSAQLGYTISDNFTLDNCLTKGQPGDGLPGAKIIHSKFNELHRYFEDLQGQSGRLSSYYAKADAVTRWHIRQLNLLCHEFESWALSYRKSFYAPEWRRPSQLMCWLNAPRFKLDTEDYDLFGIESLNRPLGGVFVGVNKSVGKHHWEVFNDEGRDSRISELTTSALITQSEAAGDFDIEWANNPGEYHWQKTKLAEFREWLIVNNFDPDDKSLTIGHPQVGRVNLEESFDTSDYTKIWPVLEEHADVFSITVGGETCVYDYHWDDPDFIRRQINIIEKGR